MTGDCYILLVEDDPNDAFLVERALKRAHVANEVVLARDGIEALAFLHGDGRVRSQLPVVVLLDLCLPKFDGFEVLARIRANESTKNLPVVVLTSSREEADVAAAYSGGVNSYVQKPVEFEAFQKVVQDLHMYWVLVNQPPPADGVP